MSDKINKQMGTTQSVQTSEVVMTEDTSGMIPFEELVETTVDEVKVLIHFADYITSCTLVLKPLNPEQNVAAFVKIAQELQGIATTPSHRLLKVQILPNRQFGHLSMEVTSLQPVDVDMTLFRSRMAMLRQAIGNRPVPRNINAALVVFRVNLRKEDEFEVISSLFMLFLKCGALLSADKNDASEAHAKAKVIFDTFGEVYTILYNYRFFVSDD